MRAVLDHLAVAAEHQEDLWPRLAGDLGGRWVSGGPGIGFSPAQVRFANGMKIEALEPHLVEQNDFLRRFLDRNGPGPHHLTFKVPDLTEALAAAGESGYHPVGVDRSDPGWQEAFIHPREVPGIVVQVAQASNDWTNDAPAGFPPARDGRTATLAHVAHAFRSLDDGLRLFRDLLGGEETGRGHREGHRWVDLSFPGPGRVRLVTPERPGDALDSWLGERRGRFHHAAFVTHAPADLPGAKPGSEEGVWGVEPEDNVGTRLLLVEDAGPLAAGVIG